MKEWYAVYVDECGDRQIVPFETFEQAVNFLKVCNIKIGVMYGNWYNHYVKEQEVIE